MPPGRDPVLVTALGDLFLAAPDGRIEWLDVGGAELRNVAASTEEFSVALYDPGNLSEFFFPELVAALTAAGLRLSSGQCFHAITPANLGGPYSPANYTTLDLLSHFQGAGKVQSQLFGLPQGTEIRIR